MPQHTSTAVRRISKIPKGFISKGLLHLQQALSGIGSNAGEDQGYLEQVAVYQQLQLALLELHQALGDV